MNTIEKAMEKLAGELPPVLAPAAEAEPARPDAALSGAGAAASIADETMPDSVQVMLDMRHLERLGIGTEGRSSRTAEEFRRIKHPLLQNAAGQGASRVEHSNLIMITSSLAGEGKTFSAINLAMSIAMEMDRTVLLVDADVAKPEVSRILGVKSKKGLIDVLLGEGTRLSDVMVRTNIPKLSLLPAGRKHARATELLASDGMRRLAQELATRYSDRIVIFDSPPMLLTSEARVLAGLMGQIVVVVEESRTPQPVLKEALALLQNQEIVGLLLNKSHQHAAGSYYGYGYYGYGYGQ
jgi:receptor protein-tyrosine kinase